MDINQANQIKTIQQAIIQNQINRLIELGFPKFLKLSTTYEIT